MVEIIEAFEHLALEVQSAEVSKRFYVDVFGAVVTNQWESKAPGIRRIIFVNLGGTVLELAERGYETVLVEKGGKLGGNAWNLNRTWKGDEVRPWLSDLIARVENHPRVNVLKNASLKTVTGSVGNFASEVEVNGALMPVSYGIAVLATGAGNSSPRNTSTAKTPGS